MKSAKTPLRYPGGKSRAIYKLESHFPNMENIKEYREPFLGGGSLAIYVAKKYPNLKVTVNDLYKPLVNFWRILQSDGIDLSNSLAEIKNLHTEDSQTRDLFLKMKDYLATQSLDKDPFLSAQAFYIVNKCSFSGLTESGGFSVSSAHTNFSIGGIEKLKIYTNLIKNWEIKNTVYSELLNENSETLIYLDPPYEIKCNNLYGSRGTMHKSFDHDLFYKNCSLYKDTKILISYNSDQFIKDRFNNWKHKEFDHTYTMRSTNNYMKDQKSRKELLLMNY